MKNSIFDILKKLELTSKETRRLFNKGTRDFKDLDVWIDDISKVIYIDNFYTGDSVYKDGSYREEDEKNLDSGSGEFEQKMDTQRRLSYTKRYIDGKSVADFGCGNGDFLKHISPKCKKVIGIEFQQSYVDSLNANGIDCVNNIDKIEDHSIDVLVSFHVIEHLPDPLEILLKLKKKIVSGGMLIIEVPHANDFLLSKLSNEAFKQFTLWSQHLILHTHESLKAMLEYVGMDNISIIGSQRYPLSNHLAWLQNGKPGGHKTDLSEIDLPELTEAYQKSLNNIQATDSLVAISKKLSS